MNIEKPVARPDNAYFSSGPCAKYPTFSTNKLLSAAVGRSHRASVGKKKLKQLIDGVREILEVPSDYQVGIVPASDTGAVEMAMWSLLGARNTTMVAWESFGKDWINDVVNELKINPKIITADYGHIVDMSSIDYDNDVVFTWNGTTSGVCMKNGDDIPRIRKGLTICDATSAAFAIRLPFEKLDVTTFSWQKVMVAEYTPLTSTVYTANDISEELNSQDPSYLNVAAMVGSEIIGAVPLLGDVAQNMIKKGVKSAADEGADVTDDLFKDTVLEETAVSATKGAAPKSTVKAYKLFRTNPDKPGELFPLFVNADKSVETGKWVDAEVGPLNEGGKVKSKIGALAFRPGWHAGDYIAATHIGGKSTPNLKKPDYRPANQVWAEVEMPNDVDWQTIANQRARIKKDGTPDVKTAHITDQVPDGGFYRYKTNSNMQGNWLIGGSMKVNKQLSDLEVKDVQKATGINDLPSLPELIDQKSLSFGDLTQVAQKELKDYYPEKFAEITADGFALGGLAVARKGITTKEGYEMADKQFQLDEDEADINNDGNLSTYEKTRGEAVQKATKEEDEIDMYHGGMMEPVDPVSGNPIPIGSSAEEVRDDIEINISQGEYVLPADVVKWHGLEKIMMLQEEAKMGLMAMDAMGLIPAVEAEEQEGEVCPKCDGEGCDHCNDTGYHTEEEETPEGNKVEEATVEVSEEEPEVRETEEYAESDYSKKTSMYGMVKKPKFTFIV